MKINSTEIFPVNIGNWVKYNTFANPEQLREQRDNLVFTSLSNRPGNSISFIYTKEMERQYKLTEDSLSKIKVIDTETALINEVYYTTKMEGAHTTIVRASELHNGAPIDKNNEYSERMVVNSFKATDYLNKYSNIITKQTIIDTWKILTDGVCENKSLGTDGYRTGDAQVGFYIPVEGRFVNELMDNFISFYNSSELDDRPLIKAAVMHYGFETIHPFCDGNGRMGRMLYNNYLISKGYEACRAVSFSMQIDKTRPYYDSAFMDSENIYNDCTPMINYMFETMYLSLESALSVQNSV